MSGQTCLAERYELHEVLGRGGMGEVRAGWDRRLDRAVAVKLLAPEFAFDAAVRRRFESEARLAAQLVHPNVVAVFDTGEDTSPTGEVPFIVMERLSGWTLADEILRGPLPVAEARAVVLQILAALDAAHSSGLVHRDVKPANVLAAADRTWKVADFGIAKSLDRESLDATTTVTVSGALVGTPAYLAPERLAGLPATPSSDLYAAGVVLYEMLTGHRPFEASTALATAALVATAQPPSLAEARPEVGTGLAAVVARAMAKDPAQRFADAREMSMAVARSSEGPATTLLAPAFGAPLPPGRPARPNWRLAAVALAGVAGLIGLLAAHPWSRAASPPPATVPAATATAAPPAAPAAPGVAPGVPGVVPAPLERALRDLETQVRR
ncbi:MAG: serine/threonine-protein kinase [Acidimicrobiales bacterium]